MIAGAISSIARKLPGKISFPGRADVSIRIHPIAKLALAARSAHRHGAGCVTRNLLPGTRTSSSAKRRRSWVVYGPDCFSRFALNADEESAFLAKELAFPLNLKLETW